MTDRLPRKVRVGTSIFPHYGEYPGLDERLSAISVLLRDMHAAGQDAFPGQALDIMMLPEHAVTGGRRHAQGVTTAADKAMSYEGQIEDTFASLAQEFGSYIAAPMHLKTGDDVFRNSIVLVDRTGRKAGVYDKCFPVVDDTWESLEDGITPAKDLPVFDCDFGRIGFQICYDMENTSAWRQLKDAGAEIVFWSTASPQTIRPQQRALEFKYWIVSSTMRNNATIFQPCTGFIHKQITDEPGVMVDEIDLSYLHLSWMPGLDNGDVFSEVFGPRVGFHYSEREDGGLFWSNDPDMSIDDMAKAVELFDQADRVSRSTELNPHWDV